MGTYLSTPVLDKCWEEGEDFSNSTPVAWGVVDMQGWRKTMEDAHIVQTDVRLPQSKSQIKAKAKTESEETQSQSQLQSESESTAEAESQPQQISTKDGEVQRVDHAQVFAVFDGHGGAEVARFCQLYLIDVLTRQAEWNGKESKTNDIGDGNVDGNVDVGKALIKCFHGIDELIDNPNRREEINELRATKPEFSERRAIIDVPAESSEVENEDEEKKSEETCSTTTATEATTAENTANTTMPKREESESDDSAASDDVIKDTEQTELDDAGENDSTAEDAATIDIAASDSISLFKKLLTITGKADAPSGTIPLNQSAAGGVDAGINEQKTIIPTIIQNGRPVCNLPDHPIHAGCTSVCAVISEGTLTVANAGDSRVVLGRAEGVTEPMSYDHKPMHETEMRRISQAGGFVNQFGRVNGNLNLSRSIGDLKYKQVPNIPPAGQMITAEPDIKQVELRDDDEFMILACDGIWDCLTNEEAVKFVRDRLDNSTPTEIGVEMLDKIVSRDPRETQGIGGDNMTVMIVDLQPQTRSYRLGDNDEVAETVEKETEETT